MKLFTLTLFLTIFVFIINAASAQTQESQYNGDAFAMKLFSDDGNKTFKQIQVIPYGTDWYDLEIVSQEQVSFNGKVATSYKLEDKKYNGEYSFTLYFYKNDASYITVIDSSGYKFKLYK